jgi:hypothetical protein
MSVPSLEHRLFELVKEHANLRERKRLAVQEYNEALKDLEDSIDKMLAAIQGEVEQPSLPFEVVIDPVPARRSGCQITGCVCALTNITGERCKSCGHLAGVHEPH